MPGCKSYILSCLMLLLFGNSYGAAFYINDTLRTGKESKLKEDLKKAEKKLSIKNLFHHHHDSTKMAKDFPHKELSAIKTKDKSPYNVDHKKAGLKVEPFQVSTEFKLDYEVLGWYPHWERHLYKNLNYSLLTTIAYFSYEMDPSTGNPKTVHDWETTPLIDSAKAHGNKVLLTVSNFGASNNKVFLKNKQAIKTFISQIKSLLKKRGGDGVCLDFEGVSNAQKEQYTDFIILVNKELKKADKNYLIYMAIPSVDWNKSIDFENVIPVVDQFVIMGYHYYGSGSKVAGPVDPLLSGKEWSQYNLSTSVDYYLTNNIPNSKLILALPYYGSIWETESDALGAKATKFIGSRSYDYIKSKIKAPVRYDSVSQCAWMSYPMDKSKTTFRQCWFDTDSTLAVKLNFIKGKKINGMGIWALGFDSGYHDLWRVIAKQMTNTNVIENYLVNNSGVSNIATDSIIKSDSSNTPVTTSGFWKEISNVEMLLQTVTDYKTVLLYIMLFVVIFGGAGFVIAMFMPDTRMFFFGSSAYRVYYASFILLFIIVILRITNVINNWTITLIIGFIAGAVSVYFINKFLEKMKKNMP